MAVVEASSSASNSEGRVPSTASDILSDVEEYTLDIVAHTKKVEVKKLSLTFYNFLSDKLRSNTLGSRYTDDLLRPDSVSGQNRCLIIRTNRENVRIPRPTVGLGIRTAVLKSELESGYRDTKICTVI